MVIELQSLVLRERHWDELEAITGLDIRCQSRPTLTIDDLMVANIAQWTEAVAHITHRAAQEDRVNRAFLGVVESWVDEALLFVPHREGDTRGVQLLDELQVEEVRFGLGLGLGRTIWSQSSIFRKHLFPSL